MPCFVALSQSLVLAVAIVLVYAGNGSAEDRTLSVKKNKNFASCLLGTGACRLDVLSVSDLSKVEAVWNLQKCRFGAPSCNKQALTSNDLLKAEQAAHAIADRVDEQEPGQSSDTDRQTAAGRRTAEAALKDLAAARLEIESLNARLAAVTATQREEQELTRDASERLAALDQERARADAATKELDAARGEIENLKRPGAELAAVRISTAEIAQRAESAQQLLARERERTEELAAELVGARHELEILKLRSIEAASEPRRTCGAGPETGQQAAVEGERANSEVLTTTQVGGEVASASVHDGSLNAALPYASMAPKSSVPVEVVPSAPPTSALAAAAPDEERFLRRAEILINRGDISAARAMLEHALDLGSARAARHLAQTYDPDVLKSWGVRGTRGNRERAQALYRRAQEQTDVPPQTLERSQPADVGSR